MSTLESWTLPPYQQVLGMSTIHCTWVTLLILNGPVPPPWSAQEEPYCSTALRFTTLIPTS